VIAELRSAAMSACLTPDPNVLFFQRRRCQDSINGHFDPHRELPKPVFRLIAGLIVEL
jgi:hypothetical protein